MCHIISQLVITDEYSMQIKWWKWKHKQCSTKCFTSHSRVQTAATVHYSSATEQKLGLTRTTLNTPQSEKDIQHAISYNKLMKCQLSSKYQAYMTKCDGACFSAARTGIAAEIFVWTSFSNAVFVLSVICNYTQQTDCSMTSFNKPIIT